MLTIFSKIFFKIQEDLSQYEISFGLCIEQVHRVSKLRLANLFKKTVNYQIAPRSLTNLKSPHTSLCLHIQNRDHIIWSCCNIPSITGLESHLGWTSLHGHRIQKNIMTTMASLCLFEERGDNKETSCWLCLVSNDKSLFYTSHSLDIYHILSMLATN